MKSRAAHGTLSGLLAFLVLAGVAYLTPVRVPVLKAAGRDYAVLRLQASHPSLHGAEAAQKAQALTRFHSRISPFGFLAWMSDIWPWLLGLGLALPALGGLIGAQTPAASARLGWGTGHPEVADAAEGDPVAVRIQGSSELDPESRTIPVETREESRTIPGEAGAKSPRVPIDPKAWDWSARPAARANPARPKPPPVRSPHGEEPAGADS